MNLDALKTRIKLLDCSYQPATSDEERAYFRHYGINFEEHDDDVSHHFGHFECDRFDIVAHYFQKRGANATCFIVHGYYDHAGLFGKLIAYCLRRNWSVVVFDLPGHGLSTGERGSIASFAEYQTVLKAVLSQFATVAPQPWHAIGQSTGGAILMDFVLSGHADTFAKTVLLAPLYRPLGWSLGRIQYALLSPFIKRTGRYFYPNSHDKDFVNFLKHRDPLQYRYLPMDWVAALKRWLTHFDRLPASDYIPLIVQGREDKTVDWKYNLPVIKSKFPGAKVFYLREGRHHLANESEAIRAKMYAAMDIYFDAG